MPLLILQKHGLAFHSHLFLFLGKSEKITKVWEGKDLAPKAFPKSLILDIGNMDY